MIYVIAVRVSQKYKEKFVTSRQLAAYKKKLQNGKIKDLIIIGEQLSLFTQDKLITFKQN